MCEAVGAWLPQAQREQHVPKWDREQEKAVLDITYTTAEGAQTCLDVSIVAGQDSTGTIRALMRREAAKHRRYPGPGLIPFVLDLRGRWGKEAQAWARAAARRCGWTDPVDKLHQLRYQVSVALQTGVAEQVKKCLGGEELQRS